VRFFHWWLDSPDPKGSQTLKIKEPLQDINARKKQRRAVQAEARGEEVAAFKWATKNTRGAARRERAALEKNRNLLSEAQR